MVMKYERNSVETNERMQIATLIGKDICSVNYRKVCRGIFPSTIVFPILKWSPNVIDKIRKGLK